MILSYGSNERKNLGKKFQDLKTNGNKFGLLVCKTLTIIIKATVNKTNDKIINNGILKT